MGNHCRDKGLRVAPQNPGERQMQLHTCNPYTATAEWEVKTEGTQELMGQIA